MTFAWGAPKPADQPLPKDVLQGLTGRYACKTLSSVDVHLDQMRARMAAVPETPAGLVEMAKLLADRDALLEVRLEMERALSPA
jgi:hypothetical protein